MQKKQNSQTNIKTLGLAMGAIVLLYVAWQLLSLIVLIITAVILAATLAPLVDRLSQKFSKKFSAAVVTIALLVPLVLALVLIIPTFLSQIDKIALSINNALDSYPFLPKLFQSIDITQYTNNAGSYIWNSTKAFTAFITQLIILIFMVYYLLIDSEEIHKLILFFVPEKSRGRINKMSQALAEISGQYIRGNLFISLICFVVLFAGLGVLKVPGAPALAMFAGIMDLLPLIGATIGAVPAVILAFTVSPLTGILTIILFWVYQEFENNIIIPRVYSKRLKIIPFLSFVSVIVGTMLFGVAGAFLALPIAASIPTVVHYFYKEKP